MKLLLTAESGSLNGRSWTLENGTLTAGRDADSQMRFDPATDRLVSKRHAIFTIAADGIYIEDLNSTNGTFVNNFRVQKIRLQNGDTIHFGGKDGPRLNAKIEGAPNFQPSNQPRQNQAAASIRNAQPINRPNQNPPPFTANDAAKIDEKSSLSNSIANRVLFNPERQTAKPAAQNQNAKYVFAASALVAALFLGLIIAALTVFELGIIPAILAAFVAFVPAVIYVLPLLWLDRYDPEPPLSLAISFVWGAVVAVFVSLIVNTIFGVAVGRFAGEGVGDIAGAVISAPIIEEATKGLAVILLLYFWRREFDGIVDGIVYAGVVALGFATVENVLYYGRELIAEGFAGLVGVFVLRGILSPFAHVIFTSMTGIGCGVARESYNKTLRWTMPFVGYFAAVTLHFCWNSLSIVAAIIAYNAHIGRTLAFLICYIIIEVPIFLIFLAFAINMTRRENKILRQTLGIEVAKGVITNEQMETATSAFRSLRWTFDGLSQGKLNARRQFLRAVSKTGLAWWHIQRAQAAGGQTMSFQQLPVLEDEITKWRDKI